MLSVVKSMKKDSFRILDTHDIRTVTEALDSVREEHGLTVTNIENIMAELAS